MWFKMSSGLMDSEVFREIKKQKDFNFSNLEKKMITFFCLTADDRANDLRDAQDLAQLLKTTEKQAAILWNACIKCRVLRETPEGFSAKPWMIEKGILGDTRPRGRKKDNTPSPELGKNFFL